MKTERSSSVQRRTPSRDALRGFYLKSLGAAEWRIDPDWIAHNADILDGADYPFEPRAIGPGTLLILYATGFQKVFGVAEVTTGAYPANRHPRWPWRCDHRILLAVDHLDDAPPLTALNVPYVELNQDEFELGVEALVAGVRETQPRSLHSHRPASLNGHRRGRLLRPLAIGLVLALSGVLGLGVALGLTPDDTDSGALVKRVRNGVTETGEVETETVNGLVRRVIRWRTKEGETLTETVRGPLRLQRVEGGTLLVAGPTHVRTTTLPGGTRTTRLPGQTTTLPGETVVRTDTLTETLREVVTETVRDTVTEVVTVTEIQPAETVTVVVTETVPAAP
jgi:hypothetical protein